VKGKKEQPPSSEGGQLMFSSIVAKTIPMSRYIIHLGSGIKLVIFEILFLKKSVNPPITKIHTTVDHIRFNPIVFIGI